MNQIEKVKKIHELTRQFHELKQSGSLDLSSEATARSWIESLLTIFDWNCKDPNEVNQEVTLGATEEANLLEIESTHRRPDYLLCAKAKSLVFIDAKKVDLTILESKKSAFQIRSYGWSAGHPYAVITNFNEFAIYDCRYKPHKDQSPDVARIFYCTYDKLVDNFNEIHRHIDRDFVLSGRAFDQYTNAEKPTGTRTLDEDFSEHIREWRLKFANNIYQANKNLPIETISEHTQLLIDRLIFCRVAEGLQIIERDTLLNHSKKSAPWNSITNYFSNDCHEKFGGFLFKARDVFSRMAIPDAAIKDFIESLYYPNPYRFDVITPVLLGNIYERYLGRKLQFKNSKVIDDFKEEYQKTKGAVYTPEYIVQSVCEKAIGPLANGKSVETNKKLRILDPSCGSGSFLLGVFAYLESQLVSRYSSDTASVKDQKYFWTNPRNGKVQLRIFAKREIINNCIFGVDIDPQAVEVARLSLSLKALESASLEPIALRELGLLDSLLLDGIGQNIKLGNSLVDSQIYPFLDELSEDDKADLDIPNGIRRNVEALKKLKVFDWKENFPNIFPQGFDAIVGNPPYIEIKHYKQNSPIMHRYLTDSTGYESCGSGKTDIAMPFIERGLRLLKKDGRLGFIVQTRFFKTDYGERSRKMLSDSKALEQIVDFGSLRVFENRTTYTSILVLNKARCKNLEYVRLDSLNQIVSKLESPQGFNLLLFSTNNNLGSEPWFFVHPDLRKLRDTISDRVQTIAGFGERISINVGLQLLFKKYYLIKGHVSKGKIVGKNLANIEVKVEKESCKAFVMNRNLFPFKKLDADTFALFPYEIENKDSKKPKTLDNLESKPIKFNSFKDKFPLAGKYLNDSKAAIQEKVETRNGNEWHLYTYEKNLCLQSLPKILIPSTCLDTTAIYDERGEFYQDNVRVNSIVINGATASHYKAVCAIINSGLFDCLSKITCESLDNGYIQFNKQFIQPVPLPISRLLGDSLLCKRLTEVYEEMAELSNVYALAQDNESKQAARDALCASETALNDIVIRDAYGLTEAEYETYKRFSTRLPLCEYIDLIANDVESDDSDAESA